MGIDLEKIEDIEGMSPIQAHALKLYCDSATIHNNYKPLTFEELADKMQKDGYKCSKSTLQRWSKRFNFEEYLQMQLQTLVLKNSDKTLEQKAIKRITQKKLVDLKRNNELTADCYEIMELFTKQVLEEYDKNGVIKKDDVKLAKDIAILTGGREDKFLDRIAQNGEEKITSDKIIEQFKDIKIEIEDD